MKKIYHYYLDVNILKKDDELPNILFIHGGPGLNSKQLLYMLESHDIFQSLKANLIVYDQRGCGASYKDDSLITHKDNIDDLENLIVTLENKGVIISTIIGHSYGARILSDLAHTGRLDINKKLVFLSTSSNISEPRINNMMFDFFILKTKDLDKYEKLFKQIDKEDIWDITSKIDIPFDIADRAKLYWANIDVYNKISKFNNPYAMNKSVFVNVRGDLYKNYDPNNHLDQVKNPKLILVGFHDYIMNGYKTYIEHKEYSKIFMKSAHYPHLEESEKFCEIINNFIK